MANKDHLEGNRFRDLSEERGQVWRWGLWIVFFFFILGFASWGLGLFGSIVSAPGRVISRTLETDNIISTYERFHDRYGVYKSRISQIASQERTIKDLGEVEVREKVKLRQELEAMRQSCRDLANAYNADSIKTNRSIFKGRDAPAELDAVACDGRAS